MSHSWRSSYSCDDAAKHFIFLRNLCSCTSYLHKTPGKKKNRVRIREGCAITPAMAMITYMHPLLPLFPCSIWCNPSMPRTLSNFTSKTIDSYRCRRVNLCWCGPNGDKSGDEVSISVPLSKTDDDDLLRWWSRLSYPAYISSSILEGSPPSVCHSFTDDIISVPSPWPSPICVQALP